MNRSLVSVALVASLSLVGCSRDASVATTADAVDRVPELPLVSLVDPAAVGALHVDLARVQSSPAYATATAWIDLLGEQGRGADDARFLTEILRARDVIVFLTAPPNSEPRATLLLRGRFTDENIDRITHQSGLESADRSHGPFAVRDIGSDGSIGRIGGHTLVLGSRAEVDAALDRQLAGGSGRYPDGEAFRALARRVDFGSAPIGFAVVPTASMRDADLEEVSPLLAQLTAANGLAFSLDPSEGLRGRIAVDLASSLEAVGLTTLARMQLGSIAADPDVVATGLSALLPFFELDRDGTTVIGSLDAPRDATERALSTLDTFVRARASTP